ncbi:putative Fe-S cluster assembly protein SufT [bacterium]|nr:putative Fe-S cluster assembly protein SufT [bacterium]
MPFEEVTLSRDVEVVMIPQGVTTTLRAGTPAVITQSLGDSYTLQVQSFGGLYRLSGANADAIGKTAGGAAQAPVDPNAPVSEDQVYAELRQVYDPEIPVNIVELGLVYDLAIEKLASGGSKVAVKMTLTAPGCGMGDIIADDARRRIAALPGVADAEVQVVFDPPWNQSMMSEAAKLELGML